MINLLINRKVRFLLVVSSIFLTISCQRENQFSPDKTSTIKINFGSKQKGAHVFGYFDSLSIAPFREYGLDWITVVPYGVQDHYQSPILRHHNGDSTVIKNSNEQWLKQIKHVRDAGFKVFVKPHIWLMTDEKGKWRSDIFPSNDENWKSWKESYTDFILRYAILAEEAEAEMFCLGAELTRLSLEKTDYWLDLLKKVRTVYSGKVTYAANWNKEYEKIPFWNQLDFIGIQAYFPLTKKLNPSIEELNNGWQKHIEKMHKIAHTFNRPILFTELGYKSTSDAGISPWSWIDYSSNDDNAKIDVETQANCYQSFFESVWNLEWIAGVHIWQMRDDFVKGRGKSDLDFTPQGKPAMAIITNQFKTKD